MSKLAKAAMMGASGAAGDKLYVEDVFSTYIYTGNNTTQAITNGVDLAGEGGMVWIKARTQAQDHILFDTVRGTSKSLHTNTTDGEYTATAGNEGLDSFNSDGFTVRLFQDSSGINNSAVNNASWTFRKAEKFFDVVTYTGDGVAGKVVSHNLGSAPGFIIIKRTDSTGDWFCTHRDLTNFGQHLFLNQTTAASSNVQWIANVNSTQFQVYRIADLNASGATYVAYLFAHDAGGFGDTGNDSVIKCGSVSVTSGTWSEVDLGWEPQFVIYKNATETGTYNTGPGAGTKDWHIIDNMRGATAAQIPSNTSSVDLAANLSSSEYSNVWVGLNSTGFAFKGLTSGTDTFIYIAIRRGPMKTPTDATTFFAAQTDNQTGNGYYAELGAPVDAWWYVYGRNTTHNTLARTRLTGGNYLNTTSTSAETTQTTSFFDKNLGVQPAGAVSTDTNNLSWVFRRAPGFFDVVAYTGTGSARTVAHNLGVVPELMIVKNRSGAGWNWFVYAAGLGNTKAVLLNSDSSVFTNSTYWSNTSPTASLFTVGTVGDVNGSGSTYIAYLFATVSGVSKVGSYTGTGTTLSIDCGFSAGARFVLIKRTDDTGDWYVWDTTRGITSGNDPYLLLNSTAAEVTNTDYIDPLSSGFQISSTAPVAINADGGSYIFLAIA